MSVLTNQNKSKLLDVKKNDPRKIKHPDDFIRLKMKTTRQGFLKLIRLPNEFWG